MCLNDLHSAVKLNILELNLWPVLLAPSFAIWSAGNLVQPTKH